MKDAEAFLKDAEEKGTIAARAVVGLFRAFSRGDDIIAETEEGGTELFSMLRQQHDREECCSLSDFIAPEKSGVRDWVGVFALSAGFGSDELVKAYKDDSNEYGSILTRAVCDRLTEAFAEYLHQEVRVRLWGYEPEGEPAMDDLLAGKYRGIRPAPGYPPCPNHSLKRHIWHILDVEERKSISASERSGAISLRTTRRGTESLMRRPRRSWSLFSDTTGAEQFLTAYLAQIPAGCMEPGYPAAIMLCVWAFQLKNISFLILIL